MRLGILGPLLVADDGGNQITVAAARQRTLLVALVVRANRTVPVEELAELVWDTAPPRGAVRTVPSYVMRLRRVVGPAVAARIVTRDPGYRCEVAEAELDMLRFEALCRQGGAAVRARAWQQGRGLLAEALGLWRGAALEDIASQSLRRECTEYLEQARLRAIEWRIEADLHLGRHEELIPELQALADRYPLREHGHAQLMLALYRCERPAEALAAFQRARQVLVQEVGIEPGRELRTLQEKILAGDAELTAPPQDDVPTSAAGHAPIVTQPQLSSALLADGGWIVPRQLPGSVRHFVGRASELTALFRLRDDVGTGPAATVICALAGMPGVGKTALAVHWAHQVAEEFPDGQLYVKLRGYEAEQPMTAADALVGFLGALGVPGPDIPCDAEERAAMYRSLLAGRRMLVLLDNAHHAEQVRPLLPGSPGCLTLVTSRDALAGLVARDGAVRLDLDLLPSTEAVGLLRALIGDRVDARPDAADALAERCGRLPLALRLAAELAAARPAASLAELVEELADQNQRLNRLDADGDLQTGIRGVFSWSYRHLAPDAARAFRLLSVATSRDIDHHTAAAVIGDTRERAAQLVDQLSRAHLLEAATPGRYAMHDLLRAYGQELGVACDGTGEWRSALTRLFDYYLRASAAAMHTLFPMEANSQSGIPLPAAALPATDHPAAARAWLDAERENLVIAAAHAAAHGWPQHAIRLASCLFRYLDAGGHLAQAVTLHTHARSAARQISDHAAEAEALTSLGVVNLRRNRLRQAACYFRQALRLCEQTGDRGGEARALADLGLMELRRGRYQQGHHCLQLSATVYRDIGDRCGEARALANLGIIERRLGHYWQASQCLLQALAVCQANGDRLSQAPVLTNLGLVELQQGRYEQAIGRHQAALALFRETGNRNAEAHALSNLGAAELRLRRYQRAEGQLRHAWTLFRETSDRAGEAEALNSLGELLLATGDPGQARAHYFAALGLTSPNGDKYEQARAHDGLAHCYRAADDPGQAARHWQEALALYTQLGAPEADWVRAQLNAGCCVRPAENRAAGSQAGASRL